ncbi:unnamed protein product [Linum tenue]|uniref:Basic blue protein n=1 Tax=Linum tenue TaxID=586396 RepID=A0AAV0GST8_9ROSI|nr:unnamed protein product [Linum tenue]
MATKGRGSAAAMAATLCLFMLLAALHFEVASAAATTYTVGGSAGWTFNVSAWPTGKRFKAGDVLVFKYNPSIHNVVAVNKAGHSGCNTPRGSRVFSSGADRIKLVKGQNYFICNFVGHCQAGMKIAITAL